MQEERRVGRKTVYTHAVLWNAAHWSLRQAHGSDYGAFYAEILALLSTAFFVEAYLNHAGALLLPKTWADEECKVPKEKLKIICKKVYYPLNFKSSHYTSFTIIFQLRKLLVHGRTKTVSGKWKVSSKGPNVLRALRVDWENIFHGIVPIKLVEDCEAFVREIHKAAGWDSDPFMITAKGISGK